MFAGLATIGESPARRWTAMVSFTVQTAMVAAALVIPLLSPQSLPEALVKRRIFVPMLSAAVHVQPGHVTGQSTGAGHLRPLIVNRNPVFTFRQTPTPAIESENRQAPNMFFGGS